MDYLLLLEQLEEYYSNLLIVQYNGKPKAQAHIKFLVNLIFANVLLLMIVAYFKKKPQEILQKLYILTGIAIFIDLKLNQTSHISTIL